MTETTATPSPVVVVVTGANGLVGARTVEALVERGATVRAVVRRAGTAPALDGVEEHVGEFHDPELAATVVAGADAVVTTVHPMGSDRETQERIAVQGTPVLARAARDAGVARLVHVSTAAVYDRSPEAGDVDESSPVVGEGADDYAATKLATDVALGEVDGLTRVLLRPPAILGAGETSVWNTLRPAGVRQDPSSPLGVPDQTFPWVHVDDLATIAADVATGRIATATDPEQGPVEGGCTPLNVAGGPATIGDYFGTVAGALGVEPVWADGPAWTGRFSSDRAHAWGWAPQVPLTDALAEIDRGLRE